MNPLPRPGIHSERTTEAVGNICLLEGSLVRFFLCWHFGIFWRLDICKNEEQHVLFYCPKTCIAP